MKHGRGEEHSQDGNFIGGFKEDKRHVYGELIQDNYTYKGEWKIGMKNGKGEE